jgi:hypothetical protein
MGLGLLTSPSDAAGLFGGSSVSAGWSAATATSLVEVGVEQVDAPDDGTCPAALPARRR